MTAEIDVDLPVRSVYNQWTQFELFPHFMSHVDEVRQLDERTLHWSATIRGVSRDWTAEITEQSPDQRIAWRSVDGTHHAGVVTFHPLNDQQTRVTLQMEMDPEGFLENVADKLGFVDRQTDKDLAEFKEMIEAFGTETGGYRGEVRRSSGDDPGPHPNEHGQDQVIDQGSPES